MVYDFQWCSAIRDPEDVVPVGLAVVFEEPLIVVDVGGSAPRGVVSQKFNVPSSWNGVLYFLLDVDSIRVQVISEGLIGLINEVEDSGFLAISDSLSMGSQDGVNIFSSGGGLGEDGLFLEEKLDGIGLECGCWGH